MRKKLLSIVGLCAVIGAGSIVIQEGQAWRKSTDIRTEEQKSESEITEEKKHQEKLETRNKIVETLDALEGSYEKQNIILQDIGKAEAEKLAEELHAEVQVTDDENYAVLYLDEGMDIKSVLEQDEYLDYVDNMIPDYYGTLCGDGSVNGAKSINGISGVINLNNTWNVTKGAGTKIAVIDTGIDTDNPYLVSKISKDSFNVITGKAVSSYGLDVIEEVDTITSHGTEVASVIAADYDSETGIGGIAPDTELVVIKIVKDGSAEITASNVIFAMAYAIEKDVDVINMSFSFEANQNPFEKYTRLAVDSDIVCVASAGNHGTSANEWPAADDNVIGVGAVSRPDSSGISASATIGDDGETKYSYSLNSRSNYGDNTDLVAPDGILVTDCKQETSGLSGTSASSALTSGAVALYLSQNKNQEYATVKETVYAAGNDMGTPGIDWYYGCGMLDVDALVTEEKGTITFDMLTEEVPNEKHIFVRNHILQDVPEPERTYSVFDGWYHDIQCLDEWDNLEEKLYEDVTMYAAWANEDDTQAYSYIVKEDGTAEITGYLGKRRYLTMPEKIDGYEITSIGTRAFAGNTRLRRIELPDTLIEIKEAAFEECTRLLSIEIPENVRRIEKRAFFACARLGTAGIYSNGALTEIGDYAFAECGSLQRIDLPAQLETVNATAFLKNMSLITITVADGNSNFTSDGEGLYGTIENKPTLIYYATGRSGGYQMDDVASIGELAFAYSRLSTVELSENLEKLQKNAFSYSRFVRIAFPDKLQGVSEETFVQCDSLRRVELGKNIEEIGDGAFAWCTSLEEIIPAEENMLVSIGAEAFRSCVKLKDLEFIGKKCEIISTGAFYECLMVKEVTLPASIQKIGKYSFCGCRGLETVIFEDGIQLTQLEDWAFNGCESIKNIILPEGLKEIGKNCFLVTGLEYIYIPSTVEKIGYGAFGHCQAMQKIEAAEENPIYYTENNVLFERKTDEETEKTSLVLHTYPAGLEGAYSISDEVDVVADWAFYAAQKLTDIQFGENIIKIGDHAFGLCHGLQEVSFNEKLETIGDSSFEDCQGLQTVICNKNLQRIGERSFWICMSLRNVSLNEGLLELGNSAFSSCYTLEEIRLPDSLQTIGTECFSECHSLKKMEISKGVRSIGMYAFSHDFELTEITFAEDCQLSRLNYGTFASCGIQRIIIPKSVESMGQEIFTSCDKLEEVIFEENSRLTALAAWTFLHTDALQTIRFEEGAQLTHIEARAFEQSGNLTSIDVSKCEKLQIIDNYALNGCNQLTEFIIPENVTEIGRYAFYGCSGLTELHMPEKIDFIGRYAFAGIPNISIYFDAPVLPENLQENWDYGIRGYYLGSGEKLSNTEWEYTLLSDGTAVLMKYIGNESSVTVTEVDGYTVSAVGANVLNSDSTVQELELPETVISISNYAFENAGNLQKISIPSSVKMIGSYAFRNSGIQEVVFAPDSQLEYIDSYAFANTDAMTVIELPSTVSQIRKYAFYRSNLQTVTFGVESQLSEIGRYAFAATGLTELQLPDHELKVDYHAFDGAEKLAEVKFGSGRLQLYGYTFYNTALVNVDIPANVEYIGEYCFSFCKELLSLQVNEENKYYSSDEGILFNKTGLKLIQCPAGKTGSYAIPDRTEALGFGAFEGSHLSEINISDQSSLQTIGYKAFYNCEQIRSIHIPTAVVSLDYYAFAYCKKLNNLDIAEGSALNGIYEGAFYGCESLTAIQIPDTVMEIGEYAFYGCESLDTVIITENSMLQGIYAHAFEHTAISEFQIPDNVLEIGSYAFADCNLKTATTGKNVREVGAHAFADNKEMTEITFDVSLIAVDNGVLSGNDAIEKLNIYCYAKCQDITAENLFGKKAPVTLTEIDLQNVNTIPAEAFKNSQSLVKITTDGSMNKIEYNAFENCSSLESITGTENVENYGFGAFRNCSKLKQASFANTKVVESYAFYMCDALEEAVFSEKLERIGNGEISSNPNDQAASFYGCSSLKKVVIPDKKSGTVVIGNYAFLCAGIQTLRLGYGIEYIQVGCFRGTNIEELILPDSVINIGEEAFLGCQELKKVKFGKKIKSIEKGAFANCEKLRTVLLNEDLEEIGDYTFAYGYSWVGFDDTNCRLNSIWIPSSVKKIGSNAFSKANVFFEAAFLPDGVAADWNSKSDKVKVFMNCGKIQEINDLYYFVNEEGAVAVYYDGTASSLTVDLENEIYWICDGCFEENETLEQINLGNSVREIGADAFKECSNLQAVQFGNSVEKVGDNAFQNCLELKEIGALENVKEIGERAFAECKSLDFENMNTKLTSIGEGAFVRSGITSFECNELSDGQLGIGAFCGCDKLKSVSLNAGVQVIKDSAFADCPLLVEINLGTEIKTIGAYAFEKCIALKSVVIPEGTISIDGAAFRNCFNLAEISLPDTLESLGSWCFEACSALEKISIPQKIHEMNYLFNGCSALKEIEIQGEGLEKIIGNSFYRCLELKKIVIPKSVKYISDSCFQSCYNLTVCFEDIKLPEGLTVGWDSTIKGYILGYLGENDHSGDFSYYILQDGIEIYAYNGHETNLSLDEIDGYKVCGIRDEVFKDNEKLEQVYIGPYVTFIGKSAFLRCVNLNKVEFAENSKLKVLGESCFAICKVLQNLNLPDTIETIGRESFAFCENLQEIHLPANLKEIPVSMLEYCEKLKSLTIPKTVEVVGERAFPQSVMEEEGSLKYVQTCLVGSVDTEQTEFSIREGTTVIASEALLNCSTMEKVTIPSTISRLSMAAFRGASIRELAIPVTVEKIDEMALADMQCLEKLILPVKFLDYDKQIMEYIFGSGSYNGWITPKSLETVVVTGDKEELTINLPEPVKNLEFEGNIQHLVLRETYLDNIKFPEGLKEIEIRLKANGITIPDGVEIASIHGENLTDISLPNTLKKMDIQYCNSLEKLTVPDSVTEVADFAFGGCTSLKEVELSENIKTLPKNTFRDCVNLEKIVMPIIIPDSSIYVRFVGLFNSDELNGPTSTLETVEIKGSPEKIPEGYFSSCKHIKEVILPDTAKEIGGSAFNLCQDLRSVNIPSNCKIIGADAFFMSGIEKLALPDRVEEIRCRAFGYSAIKELVIPATVTIMEDGAFRYCNNLESIEILGNNININCDFLNSPLKKVVLPYIGTAPNKPCKFKDLIQSDSLETVILLDSCTSMVENAFEGVSGIDIYCYADVDTTVWPAGWNNGNRVHYMDQWNHLEFKVDGRTVFTSIQGLGDALKLPTKSMYQKSADANYEYTFIGWDIDGDGKAENLFTSTLRGYITAEAVYSCIPINRASHVTVQSIENKENQAIVDVSGNKANALKTVASLNAEVLNGMNGKETTVKTDIGTIIFDKGAARSIASSADQVNVTLEQVNPELLKDAANKDQLYQLSLVSGESDITFSGNAEIQLPYDTDDDQTPVVTYLSSDGKQITMEAHYSEKQKATIFNTTQFSLYALSKKAAKMGTIAFDTDGGTAISEQHKAVGREIVLPDCEKEGSVLTGWKDGDRLYTLEDEYTVITDVTLKAVWESKPDISEWKDQAVLSDEDAVYTGKEIRKSVQINGLEEGKDFIVEYSEDLINAGTVTITITGIGQYTGILELTYQIKPRSLLMLQNEMNLSETEVYHDGTEKKPEVVINGLLEDKDYILEYQNNVEVGTATVKVSGLDNYCDEVELEFEMIHNPEKSDRIEADCIHEGKTEGSHCQFCGEILSGEEEIPALGHEYGEWKETKAATCTEKGEESRICSRDAEHIETREIPVKGHTEKEVEEIPATCTESGRSAGTECEVCGEILSGEEEIPALSHDYGEWKETKAATCTEEGEERRICSRDAEHIETREIPAKGHTEKEIVEIPATCTESGRSAGIECEVCGELLRGEEEIPALGHDYGEWYTTENADYGISGKEERQCKRDASHKELREIPALQIELSECEVRLSEKNYVFDGIAKEPAVTVLFQKKELIQAVDYQIYYMNNLEPGTATVQIVASENGLCKGKVSAEFVIKPAMDENPVTILPNAFSNCSNLINLEIKETVTEIGDCAFADCKNLINIYFYGNAPRFRETVFANVKATAYYPYNDSTWSMDKLQNYGGTITWLPWNPHTKVPEKRSILLTDIRIKQQNFVYDGTQKIPEVVVSDGSMILKEKEDYVIHYSNNVQAGTAMLIIDGIGNYGGRYQTGFEIQKANSELEFEQNIMTRKYGEGDFTNPWKVKLTDGTIKWTSDHPEIVSVDSSNGILKIMGVGTAVITVTVSDGINYKAKTVSFTVKTEKAEQMIRTEDIIRTCSAKAQSATIKAFVKDGAKQEYRSNQKSVKVNQTGKVTIAKNFVGRAVITIHALETGHYHAAISSLIVEVRPAGVKISKITNSSKGKVKVSWKKNKQATGYMIQYTTDKNFNSDVKTVTVKKAGTVKTTLSKMKKGKTYYVRIKTYKSVGKTKITSSWSKAKSVKVKK